MGDKEDTPLVDTQLRFRLINYAHSSICILEALARQMDATGKEVRDTNNSKDSIELLRKILSIYEDMKKEIKVIEDAEKAAVELHNKLYGGDYRKQ